MAAARSSRACRRRRRARARGRARVVRRRPASRTARNASSASDRRARRCRARAARRGSREERARVGVRAVEPGEAAEASSRASADAERRARRGRARRQRADAEHERRPPRYTATKRTTSSSEPGSAARAERVAVPDERDDHRGRRDDRHRDRARERARRRPPTPNSTTRDVPGAAACRARSGAASEQAEPDQHRGDVAGDAPAGSFGRRRAGRRGQVANRNIRPPSAVSHPSTRGARAGRRSRRAGRGRRGARPRRVGGGGRSGRRRRRPQRPARRRAAAATAASGRIAGNRITSRIAAAPAISITSRSSPIPSPPVGGSPYSSARM